MRSRFTKSNIIKSSIFAAVAAAHCLSLTIATTCFAEELDTIFKRVDEFVVKKNYPKALEELAWARNEVEKLHTQELRSFFPDQLAGLSGRKIEVNAALGFSNVERTYMSADSSMSVKVSLVGGSGPGGAAQGLGGLASLGKMAALMGAQAGQETLRVAGRTATLQSESGRSPELTVFLESGSMLQVSMQKGQDTDVLKKVAGAMALDDLDKYLSGQRG